MKQDVATVAAAAAQLIAFTDTIITDYITSDNAVNLLVNIYMNYDSIKETTIRFRTRRGGWITFIAAQRRMTTLMAKKGVATTRLPYVLYDDVDVDLESIAELIEFALLRMRYD